MRRLRILVCGSNYAQTYIQAIHLQADSYELAGVLGRGSRRSAELAARCGVPLYTDAGELPGDIDIACAALGRAGNDTVLQLLRRRIHALCEHPQRTAWLEAALREAGSAGVRFHLNGHFGALPAPEALICRSVRQRQSEDPVFIQIAATDRSLYGTLDILRSALGPLETFNPGSAASRGSFTAISGSFGALPATILVQTSDAGEPDGSPRYVLDLRITLGFASGVLTLLAIAGPVTWNASYGRCDATGASLWESVYDDPEVSAVAVHRQRILANLTAIDALAHDATHGTAPAQQSPEHILDVSRSWEAVAAALSRP